MSRSVNKVILVGNVAADPAEHADGTATLSLATRTPDGQHTDWHRVVFPRHYVKGVMAYVRAKSRLFVDGRISYGSYDRDGQSIPTADIVVNEYVLLTAVAGPVADALLESVVPE